VQKKVGQTVSGQAVPLVRSIRVSPAIIFQPMRRNLIVGRDVHGRNIVANRLERCIAPIGLVGFRWIGGPLSAGASAAEFHNSSDGALIRDTNAFPPAQPLLRICGTGRWPEIDLYLENHDISRATGAGDDTKLRA